MLKVLYHHRIASKDGQYVHIESIVNAFKRKGDIVRLVGPEFTDNTEFGHDGGFVNTLKSKLPKFIYEFAELGYSLVVAKRLIKEIKTNRPDIIYERYNLYQPIGVMIAKWYKIPLILEVNAPLKEERQKHSGLGMPWLAQIVENYTWKNASKVLPVTKVLADICVNNGVKKESIEIIHNGVTEEQIKVRRMISKKNEDNIVIGFVGFMHLTCGVAEAIKVIAKIGNKKVKLVCAGDGEQADELKLLAEKLGVSDQVDFLGLVSREEIMKHVDFFDIALQPDVTEYASPLKLFEYMVSKCLIIAPDSDNIKEILTDESALFFKYKDKVDFSSKLEFCLNNIDSLESKKEAAFDRLSEAGFTWDNNVVRIKKLASDLIK